MLRKLSLVVLTTVAMAVTSVPAQVSRAQDTLKIGVPSVNDKGVKVDPSRFIADSGLKMPELAPGVLTAVS